MSQAKTREKYTCLKEGVPVRKTAKKGANESGLLKKGQVVIVVGRQTVDGVERLQIQSQIQDKHKVAGWVRSKEKGQPVLVPEGAEFGAGPGTAPPPGMSAAEKLKWQKAQRPNVTPTLYSDNTLAAIDASIREKATAGAIPGSINWGIKPVSVSFGEPGKIGVTWVPVRDAITGSETVTIESIAPGGQMDKQRQLGAPLCPGLALSKVAAQSTSGMAYTEVIEFMGTAPRPLKMQFAGIAKDTPDEVQSALAKGEALPETTDSGAAFHEMVGKSKVAARLKGKVWKAELGRKRTVRPITISPGEGGEAGHVDITSAIPGKTPELLQTLPYLEIQTFYVDKGSEPHICFSHRPDPEGVARKVKAYMPSDQATELAEALMALLREINERRNPNAAFQQGGTAVSKMADAMFRDGQTTGNPIYDTSSSAEDSDSN